MAVRGRPRRRTGRVLTTVLVCPLCRTGASESHENQRIGEVALGTAASDRLTIRFRSRTARMQCPTCGLRFSIYPRDVAAGLRVDGIRDYLRVKLEETLHRYDLEEVSSRSDDAADYLEAVPKVTADLLDEAEVQDRRLQLARDGNSPASGFGTVSSSSVVGRQKT